MTYKIVRFYENGKKRIIDTGLTLEEAKKHCDDKKTSGVKNGVRYFDGFVKEE